MAEAAEAAGAVSVQETAAGEVSQQEPSVTVRSLPGNVLAEIEGVSMRTIKDLKAVIETRLEIPARLQKLLKLGESMDLFVDEEELQLEPLEVVLVVDETPLATWDIEGNPAKGSLSGEGGHLTSEELRTDFVNVFTQEPVRIGRHYFQFEMRRIGDEQWCGVATSKDQVGTRASGRSLNAWTYFCGRMGRSSEPAALHTPTRVLKEFKKPKANGGTVLGLAVDVDKGVVAFDCDGEPQGAVAVPKGPLYLSTQMDTPQDEVMLKKLCLQEAPPEALAALDGPLLDPEGGRKKSVW